MTKKIKIKQLSSDATINLALDTISINKQALIFVNTKRSAEKTAENIAKRIKANNKELNKLSEEVLNVLPRPTKQCERLAKCIAKGVAFHHAGLHAKQRTIVENAFRESKVRIIATTPTLACGLDLPAFRTILRDLKRYGHRGLQYIPVLEYHQQAGRAGRPKYDSFGEAICIASTEHEKEEIYRRYIQGEPEDIYSKLAVEPVLRTYVLSLIASGFTNTKQQLLKFFEKTFWAYQFKDITYIETIIDRMLSLLMEWGFISQSEFVSADEINTTAYKTTPLGNRVAELYIDPLTAHYFVSSILSSHKKKLIAFSFLQLVAHTVEMRPLLRTKVKELEFIQDKLTYYEHYLIDKEPSLYDPEYDEFIDSVKTALFMQDWIDEKDEEYLLETYNIRPGEIRVKLDNADWLLYALEELTRIVGLHYLIKEIKKTRLRLKHGIKEELMSLIKLRGIGRVRARKLYANKLKNLADIKKASVTTLSQILGTKVALGIKKQLGQSIANPVDKNQEGLKKY